MIRLDRIELLNWDIQAHQVLPLASGVTILTGENGSGKTSILDAIKVGLGARRLRGGRSIQDYLLRRAAPTAMVRLVVDNTSDQNRRRPFDALGGYGEDAVSLAVVFEADRQGDYERSYFIIDGDRVPKRVRGEFISGSEPGRLDGPSAYRERLERIGISREYRRLLAQPQGEIASLCRHDGTELFRRIYDIIGGQEALDEWKTQLEELRKKEHDYEQSQRQLDSARKELEILESKAQRHHEFRAKSQKLELLTNYLPHLRLDEARAQVGELRTRLKDLQQHQNDQQTLVEHHVKELRQLQEAEQELEEAIESIDEESSKRKDRRDELRDELAEAKQSRRELLELRHKAKQIDPVDPAKLESLREGIDSDLAKGNTADGERERRLATLREQLEQIEQGILPFPEDVQQFQKVLRNNDIPHHLLAQVVDVDDDRWTPAIESFLGRYRFAVLVTDTDRWKKAARLAREYDYEYGVLTPDYRGHSKYDEVGLFPCIDVHESDYTHLVARLFRQVQPGEPEAWEPPERSRQVLSEDGFVISRIEARMTSTTHHYLGRNARERRREQIGEEIAELEEASRRWKDEAATLRHQRRDVEQNLRRQRTRLKWEHRRDELSDVKTCCARLESKVEKFDEQLDQRRKRRDRIHSHLRENDTKKGGLEQARKAELEELDALHEQIRDTQGALQQARTTLGEREAVELPELTDEEYTRLQRYDSSDTVQSLIKQLQDQLQDVSNEVRDPLILRNFERQQQRVERVEQNLEESHQAMEKTRSAARQARDQYHRITKGVFRSYFARLRDFAERIGFEVNGRLEQKKDDDFRCVIRLSVGNKPPVHHNSEDLSGGEKAALSILMGMTAVSLNSEGAGFFLIDEPFHHSDIHKINELGNFLDRTHAQYLLSMPTSADLEQCGDWLDGVWVCNKATGTWDDDQIPQAPPLKIVLAPDARSTT